MLWNNDNHFNPIMSNLIIALLKTNNDVKHGWF